jgi:hypothetical protein
MENHGRVWRYIVRSKDRTSGVPNNFAVTLPNAIPDNVSDIWLRVDKVTAHTYPPPTNSNVVAVYSNVTGFYNQFSSNVAEVFYGFNRYGFDTGAFVDVCVADFGTPNTMDTETGASPTYITSAEVASVTATSLTLPISNKTGLYVGDTAAIAGVTGTLTVTTFTKTGVVFSIDNQTTSVIPISTQLFVTPAQPYKTRGDKTLVLVPYSRGTGESNLTLYVPEQWVKMSSRNLANLTVKLFNDRGFPLKLRKLTASATPNAIDFKDIDIDEWVLEFSVMTSSRLPFPAVPHKI